METSTNEGRVKRSPAAGMLIRARPPSSSVCGTFVGTTVGAARGVESDRSHSPTTHPGPTAASTSHVEENRTDARHVSRAPPIAAPNKYPADTGTLIVSVALREVVSDFA